MYRKCILFSNSKDSTTLSGANRKGKRNGHRTGHYFFSVGKNLLTVSSRIIIVYLSAMQFRTLPYISGFSNTRIYLTCLIRSQSCKLFISKKMSSFSVFFIPVLFTQHTIYLYIWLHDDDCYDSVFGCILCLVRYYTRDRDPKSWPAQNNEISCSYIFIGLVLRALQTMLLLVL